MSEVIVQAVVVDAVYPHPCADRLDVLRIGNNTICDERGKHKPGDIVAHFPPDILIPPSVGKSIGIDKYLKDAHYPGDFDKSKCRVGAIRLRTVPSFGFVLGNVNAAPGDDLSERFHAVKFDPPPPVWYKTMKAYMSGPKCPPEFHRYTNIQNFRHSNYTYAFREGEPVRILEKIHGTNSRVALIRNAYFCGSHRAAVDESDTNNRRCIYWLPLNEKMKSLLEYVSGRGAENVVVFGEIYGSKVQWMDYGIYGYDGYVMFDISINGRYMPWSFVEEMAHKFDILMPPVIYTGAFKRELIEMLVDGPTRMCPPTEIRTTFKGREGIVITPQIEQFSEVLSGRLILKAISCDYLAVRKSDCH